MVTSSVEPSEVQTTVQISSVTARIAPLSVARSPSNGETSIPVLAVVEVSATGEVVRSSLLRAFRFCSVPAVLGGFSGVALKTGVTNIIVDVTEYRLQIVQVRIRHMCAAIASKIYLFGQIIALLVAWNEYFVRAELIYKSCRTI